MSELFWRLHRSALPPLTRANAWSTPWGDDDAVPVRGYSATETAEQLVRYFVTHAGGIDDNDVIALFYGTMIGVGPDNEPLVLPDVDPRTIWFRGADLDKGLLEHEGTAAFEQVVKKLGSKRRICNSGCYRRHRAHVA